jgi:hypothetical protein
MKSETCFSQSSGKPLSEYDSDWEAQLGADYALENFGNKVIPYECDVCQKWHLQPESRYTPSKDCFVCSKKLYETKDGADKRARLLFEEQGKVLNVYACPHSDGWHLTKR